MPSMSTVTLRVNFPPRSAIIVVTPVKGEALNTQFLIDVKDVIDGDQPFNYKYSFYLSQEHLDLDIKNSSDFAK